MTQFVGILDGADDVWGIRIPDFPGCHGAGATAEEARSDAIGALREYVAALLAKGVRIPLPRTMTEVRADPKCDYDPDRESFVMVPLLLDKARSVRANISIDAGVLEAVDEAAEERGLTRSSFFASAAMDKIVASRSAKRTVHRSSGGGKPHAVRDKEGALRSPRNNKSDYGSSLSAHKKGHGDKDGDRTHTSRNKAKKHK